ncbi:MAG: MoaD/ThiS family protein [Betaproteobacteria bacterium]|nr:MoaD/ThiS family protein [Betaproteobacteria bacterium]
MARIVLSGNLAAVTGGETEIALEVGNVRQLFQALAEHYPGLPENFAEDLAVAIDGEIYQDALLEPIRNDSEVILFPKIAGG